MSEKLNCRETVDYYRRCGFQVEEISNLTLTEFSKVTGETFSFDAFTAVMPGLTDTFKEQVFHLAEGRGYYLVPILERVIVQPSDGREKREHVLAWIPLDTWKKIGSYLEDFERLVKDSYDYLQEAEGLARLATDIEMIGGYVDGFENSQMLLRDLITNTPADEHALTLAHHFRGETGRTFNSLAELVTKLMAQWDQNCPNWKIWLSALGKEWHVDRGTDSPFVNFRMMMSEMQRRADQAK